MMTINLRSIYPELYKEDYYVTVSAELAKQFSKWKRDENAHMRQRYRYKAHYSLDCGDGIEHDVLLTSLPPDEIVEQKFTVEELHAAMLSLPEKQRRRIYALYSLGLSQSEIARQEGVSRNVVSISVSRGLDKLARQLRKIKSNTTE